MNLEFSLHKKQKLKSNYVHSIYSSSFITSDYRIKQNVTSIDNTPYTMDNLKPVFYFNKVTQQNDFGFIAHELQEQFPFLVVGEKDGPNYQNVNYLSIISLLTYEIQQLKKQLNNHNVNMNRKLATLTSEMEYLKKK